MDSREVTRDLGDTDDGVVFSGGRKPDGKNHVSDITGPGSDEAMEDW